MVTRRKNAYILIVEDAATGDIEHCVVESSADLKTFSLHILSGDINVIRFIGGTTQKDREALAAKIMQKSCTGKKALELLRKAFQSVEDLYIQVFPEPLWIYAET